VPFAAGDMPTHFREHLKPTMVVEDLPPMQSAERALDSL
jgi:hypothetical protein